MMKVNLKRIVILSLMVMLCLVLGTAQRRPQRSRRSSKTTQRTPRMTRHTPKVGERETVTNPKNPNEYDPALSEPEQGIVVGPVSGANTRSRTVGLGNSNQGNSNAVSTSNANDEGIAVRFLNNTKPAYDSEFVKACDDKCYKNWEGCMVPANAEFQKWTNNMPHGNFEKMMDDCGRNHDTCLSTCEKKAKGELPKVLP